MRVRVVRNEEKEHFGLEFESRASHVTNQPTN